jgi:hypothetical protein
MAGKIFGTVKNNASFCEIRYSWYTKHHHTLKRFAKHKRVRFQMNRVIRDHLESGYISKVEYRAVKEPDQGIDYVIRYYPGPGAKDSNQRIQQFIRERRNSNRQRPSLHGPASAPDKQAEQPTLALSVITSAQRDLTSELIRRFRIDPLRATKLVVSRSDVVSRQIEAWPFRTTTPRNPAGWMIQAIENN